jgi:outer membrane assembly lipoprotein YfiO
MRSISLARPISTRYLKSPATRTAPRKAVQNLEEVARKYPTSEYAVASKRKIEIARDQLAGKEMDVGRQLLNERAYTGAINRFKVVVTRYQRTRHVEEPCCGSPRHIWRSASSRRPRPRRRARA